MTETTWSLERRVEALMLERKEMIDDLDYMNKMILTLMSLLPPEVTAQDIRTAMIKQGGEIREERTSGNSADIAG